MAMFFQLAHAAAALFTRVFEAFATTIFIAVNNSSQHDSFGSSPPDDTINRSRLSSGFTCAVPDFTAA